MIPGHHFHLTTPAHSKLQTLYTTLDELVYKEVFQVRHRSPPRHTMPTGTVSIGTALPNLTGSAAGPYRPISGHSGHSTAIAHAPKTIEAFPNNFFQNYIQSPALQAVLQTQLNNIPIERSHNLASEGDIERAAALYLVHDVNLIFERLLTNLGIPANEYECVGQSTSGNSRPDIKFRVQDQIILVLEYKRTYVFYLLVSRLSLLTDF